MRIRKPPVHLPLQRQRVGLVVGFVAMVTMDLTLRQALALYSTFRCKTWNGPAASHAVPLRCAAVGLPPDNGPRKVPCLDIM